MQNVHAMRPEVRADHERALQHVSGDDVFATRFERFFTELRDPLVTLYGDDPRFDAQWRALLEAIARTAAGRAGALRALDHEREITPDWLQREQAVGYVTYVDRFAGTLAGVREKLLIAELALDDVSVELCKAIVLRASQEAPLSRETELRLVDSDSKGLALAWLSAADEVVGDSLHLSRRLYDEITSDTEGAWAPLRSDLTQGLFVDLARLMLAD